MASRFKTGLSAIALTSLDELTTPVPDPQPEYLKYSEKVKLGNGQYLGRGKPSIIWEFPLMEIAEQEQALTEVATSPMYIQSPDENDDDAIWQVEPNVPDPRESGSHKPGFKGYRTGLLIEFVVLAEVGVS